MQISKPIPRGLLCPPFRKFFSPSPPQNNHCELRRLSNIYLVCLYKKNYYLSSLPLMEAWCNSLLPLRGAYIFFILLSKSVRFFSSRLLCCSTSPAEMAEPVLKRIDMPTHDCEFKNFAISNNVLLFYIITVPRSTDYKTWPFYDVSWAEITKNVQMDSKLKNHSIQGNDNGIKKEM